jgi:small subunit ribosomal protein S6
LSHNLSWERLHVLKTVQSEGGEIVKAYELLMMINPTLDEQACVAIAEKSQALITAEGGTVDSVNEWGKRTLAYEINKLKDAYYTLVEFHHDPFAIAEIDRVLRITDGIMRYMLVCRTDKPASKKD